MTKLIRLLCFSANSSNALRLGQVRKPVFQTVFFNCKLEGCILTNLPSTAAGPEGGARKRARGGYAGLFSAESTQSDGMGSETSTSTSIYIHGT